MQPCSNPIGRISKDTKARAINAHAVFEPREWFVSTSLMISEVVANAGDRDAQAAHLVPKLRTIGLDFRISLEQLRRKFNETSHHLRMMEISRDDVWIAGEDWLERINSRIDAFAAILRAEKLRLRVRTNLIGENYSFSRIFDAPPAARGRDTVPRDLQVGEIDGSSHDTIGVWNGLVLDMKDVGNFNLEKFRSKVSEEYEVDDDDDDENDEDEDEEEEDDD